jgi:hypothetical protein
MDHKIKCKLCGEKHMLGEPHAFMDEAPFHSNSMDHARLHKPSAHAGITAKSTVLGTLKHCSTCRCFPMTAAERQKAYRERHKAK